MKKRLTRTISFLLILCSLASLSSCGGILDSLVTSKNNTNQSSDEKDSGSLGLGDLSLPEGNPEQSTHTHLYGTWQIEDGKHYKICACGDKTEEGAHTPVSAGIAAPTFDSPGHSAGSVCSVCNHLLSGDATLPAFSSARGDYAYKSLGKRPSGENLQAFYRVLYTAASIFHTSKSANATEDDGAYIAFSVSFGEYALTAEEAFLVLHALKADCPLFYWIDNRATTYGDELRVHTATDYARAEARYAINTDIYAEMLSLALPTDTYSLVLTLHDTIIDRMTYAYKSDGTTPEDAAWAHSIVGYFTHDKGVCETYAETFSLFLYYYGIDNIMVSGTAGGPHAWNLVQMDDGRYYWFDVTWDDQPTQPGGRIYDYFCKTDLEFLLSERRLDTATYTYPARSMIDYTGEIPTVGTAFTVAGSTYTVTGAAEVELTLGVCVGNFTVPQSVTYREKEYAVTAIGNLDGNTLKAAFAEGVTGVTIPKSVKSVRANAFSVQGLVHLSVASDNPYLLCENLALYEKDTHTLIAYLPSASAAELALRGDTEVIATFSVINNGTLTTLSIGKNVKRIERQAIANCPRLSVIEYAGTRAEWQAITFGASAIPAGIRIVCSDDTFTTA